MKRRIAIGGLLALAALAGAQQVSAAPACEINYTGASGSWATAGNWDLGRVPAAGDDVCVPGGRDVTLSTGTVNIDSLQAGGTLKLSGATLTIAGDSSVARLDLSLGSLAGAGDVEVAGGTWSGGNMAGTGTTTVTGTLAHSANTSLNNGRVLEIEGTLDMTADRYINTSGAPGGTIVNKGLIKRTGTGIATLYPAVDNDGRIEGQIDVAGGGGGSGDFAGAVRLHAGTFALDGADLAGVTLSGATVNGTATATGVTMTGGTVGAGTLTVAGPFTWSGGTMTGAGATRVAAGATLTHTANTVLNGGRVLEIDGTLDMATDHYINTTGTPAGVIRNRGLIKRTGTALAALYPAVDNDGRVEGALELHGGGASKGVYAGGAKLHVGTFALDGATLDGVTLSGGTITGSGTATGVTMTNGAIGGSGTLTVAGPFTWSGGAMNGSGVTRVAAGARLSHTANTDLTGSRVLEIAGALDMTAARYINATGTGTTSEIRVLAGGVIERTAATGVVQLYPRLDNDGTVRGAIELRGGSAGESAGVFGPGGVTFSAGTYALGQGASLAGATLANATLNVTETATATGTNRLAGGTLGGAGTLDVTGTLEWTDGKMAGPGRTRVAQGGTLELRGFGSLTGGRTLENAGLLDVKGDHMLLDDFDAPAELVHNTGAIRKTAGTGPGATIGLPLRNDGTVDGAVGELRLDDGASVPDTGVFTGTDAANHVVLGGARTLTGAVQLTGTTEIAGDVTVRPGDTLVAGGEVLQTQGGDLRGDLRVTGTLRWDGGGHAAPGTTTVAPGGRILVTGLRGHACGSPSLDANRRLVNQGLLRLDAGDLFTNGTPRPLIENAGRIELAAGASCGATRLSGDALLRNTGTIEGAGELALTLDNDGSVTGALAVESTSTVGHSGAFRGVTLADGILALEPGASWAGATELADGELRIPAGMTLPVAAGDTLRMTGGAVGGEGTLSVAGTLAWDQGEQLGPGTTVIAPGGTATVAGPDEFAALREDRALVNRGTVSLAGGTLFVAQGASLLNAAQMTVAGGSKIDGVGSGFGFGGLIHNTGTLRKAGTGTAVAEVPLDNDGTLEVIGGTLEASGLRDFTGTFSGGRSGLSNGTYVVGAGTLVLPGPVEVNGARLALGAGSQVVYKPLGNQGATQDALALLGRNTGALELGRPLTVGAFTNDGSLAVGAGSTLTTASFRQGPGGVLRPAVAGAASAGRVTATGAAALGGRLDAPAAAVDGDIPLLTASAVTGTFGAVTGGYEPIYGSTEVKLRRRGGAPTERTSEPDVSTVGDETVRASDSTPDTKTTAAAVDADAVVRIDVARRVSGRAWARVAPGVTGRGLSLVVATCPRCGSVRVSWAGTVRTVSLRSPRPGRRTIVVVRNGRERSGDVRVRAASQRRVAIDALVVARG